MDALQCIKERRSIRNYEDKKISKEILEEIINCGRLAPSASNTQPWEFVVVTKKDLLEKIAEIATYGYFIKDAGACVIVCGDSTNHHLVEDCCAATENILLAAKAFGIGSCWVAGYKKDYNKEIKELLGIPNKVEIVSILSLGYPREAVKSHGKRVLKDVLHWEKY